jgi:hypothetical protein
MLVVSSVRGPLLFWQLVWTSAVFRTGYVALFSMICLWTMRSVWRAGHPARGALEWNTRRVGGAMLAWSGLVLLGFCLLPKVLAALNQAFNVLPMGTSLMMALRTQLGIPAPSAGWIASGVALIWSGWSVGRRGPFARKARAAVE